VAYGHAERNLVLIRQLEAETRQLLATVTQPDPEQSAWMPEAGPDNRLWQSPGEDSRSPHWNDARPGAGSPYTALAKVRTAEPTRGGRRCTPAA
jgi:hypothetical protein